MRKAFPIFFVLFLIMDLLHGQNINNRTKIGTINAECDGMFKNTPEYQEWMLKDVEFTTTTTFDIIEIPESIDVHVILTLQNSYGEISYIQENVAVPISYDEIFNSNNHLFEGSFSQNIPMSNYGWARGISVSGNIVLLPPFAPQIDINNTQNNHVTAVTKTITVEGKTTTATTYTVCDCDCQTVFQTGYIDEGMEYVWRIYLGQGTNKTLLYTSENLTVPTFSKVLKSIHGLDNLTTPQDITVTVTPSNTRFSSWTFPTSKELVVTIRPQSKFIPLESERNIDIYPKFNAQDRKREGWSILYRMEGVHLEAIQCQNELSNAVDATGDLLGDNKRVLYYNDDAVFKGKIAPYVLRAQVATGETTFSEKSCYAEAGLLFPAYQDNDAFTIAKTGNINQRGDNYYICSASASESNKISITSKRGQSLIVKKNGVVFKTIDIKYARSATSPTVTLELPITSDNDLGNYEIIYTDILGNALPSYSFTLQNVHLIGIDNITIDKVNQLCSTTINGKLDGVATVTLPTGWDYTKIKILENGTLVSSGENEANQFTANLAAKNYTAKFDNFKHVNSGCIFSGGSKDFSIGKIDPKITFNSSVAENTYLDCNNSTISTVVTSNDSRLKILQNNNTEISANPQILKTGNSYVYKTSYEGCSDTPISVTKNISTPTLSFGDRKISYTLESNKYAVVRIPISAKNPENGWKIKVVKNGNEAIIDDNLNNRIVSGEIEFIAQNEPLTATNMDAYSVRVYRENCPTTLFDYDKTSINIYSKIKQVINSTYIATNECNPQAIVAEITNGSGTSAYVREYLAEDGTYTPYLSDKKFGVGFYFIRAKDTNTGITTDPIKVTVGAESTPKIATSLLPDITLNCHNDVAIATLNVEDGSGNYKFYVGTTLLSSVKNGSGFNITIPSNVYTSSNSVAIKVTDPATGCFSVRAAPGDKLRWLPSHRRQ